MFESKIREIAMSLQRSLTNNKSTREKMKEYLREARATPRNSRAFQQKTRFLEKERCTNCEKSWKAVKFFQQRQPAIYRAGEG
jgi:hypothetical protein